MKKSILGIVAIVVMMAVVMAGCPSPTTDEDPVFNGVLYEDGFTPFLTEPLYWNQNEKGFAVDGDTNIKYSGSTSFKVDWSQATDWNAVAVSRGSGQTPSGTLNLTAFDALTFYAKAEAETTIEKFGFAAGSEYEIFLKDQTITTAWVKYVLPLPDAAKLTGVENMFYASSGANGGVIYLDEIKFEKLGTIGVKTFDYDGSGITIPATSTKAIADLTATITVDGTDVTNLSFEDPTNPEFKGGLANWVTWTSADTTKATVAANGVITGIAASGTVDITGTLGDKTVTITVTGEAAPAPFDGTIFDDALQNGFAASINASTGEVAAVTDESTVISGASGKSVKFALDSASTWGGGYLQNVTGVDASSYTSLSFDINLSQLDSTVDFLQFKLEDTDGGATVDTLNLYDLTETATTGDWKSYTVYLASYSIVDFSKFKAIGFWHPRAGATYTPGTFYVDNVEFGMAAPPSYTVTYHANPDGKTLVGSLSRTSDTVNSGSTIASAPGGISIADHVLRDWNNQPDGSGHSFVFGLNSITDDMDLYAQWVVDKLDERYYFLGDATGVGTPEMEGSGMTHFGGYDNTITFTTEASGGADSTSGYFKLVGSESQGWAAGGWGDGPYIDFTGYDTLVFWAKVPGTPTVGKIAATQVKFVLTSRHRTSGGDVGGPIITRPEGSNFTTTWTKYEIPLIEITSDTNFMQEAIKEFKYDFLGNNHELHLDEIYLRASGNAPALAVTVPATLSKTISERPAADTVLDNIAKLTTVTAGATLSYGITVQSKAGAMSIDSDTGVLKVADTTQFVYNTNTELTATVQVTASDGVSADETADIAVTITITPAPADAPTAPTTAAADVINLFSDTYAGTAATQIDVTNWDPDWGQTTVDSEVTIAGNTVKKYSNLGYQGIEFTNEDVSAKTKLHFDLWTADETSFTFFLISPGTGSNHEYGVAKTPTFDSWNSYDIDLSDYTTGNSNLDLTDLFQIKIVGSGGKTVFLDNIYFY